MLLRRSNILASRFFTLDIFTLFAYRVANFDCAVSVASAALLYSSDNHPKRPTQHPAQSPPNGNDKCATHARDMCPRHVPSTRRTAAAIYEYMLQVRSPTFACHAFSAGSSTARKATGERQEQAQHVQDNLVSCPHPSSCHCCPCRCCCCCCSSSLLIHYNERTE